MLKIGSLHLKIPFGNALITAAPILALIVLGCEVVLRVPQAQSELLLPVLTGHYELGPKETLASRLSRIDGPIDCFFVGNSSVGKSIMPDVFEQAYQAQTGQPIRCFNFGIDSLTLEGGQRLIAILAKRYHPRLIIYGIHYTNFTSSGANTFGMDTPWARFQLGALDLEGGLESALVSYRYALTYTQAPAGLERSVVESGLLTRGGYKPNKLVEIQEKPPKETREQEFYETLVTFDVQGHRGQLDALLSGSPPGVQIVLADMPIPATTVKAFGKSGYNYEEYLGAISQQAASHLVLFIPAVPADLIPADGYQDPIHLNDNGASAYSGWLGQQIGALAQQGMISSLQR